MDLPLNEMNEIHFNKKRVPISPEFRPLFRISQVVLILYMSSTKQSASLLKLQLFNWVLQNEKRYDRLINLKSTNHFPIIRFDPFLNRALGYAAAMDLISFNNANKKFFLKEKGEKLALEIIDEDVFEKEKTLFNKIKKGISDTYINSIFKERYSS